MEVTSISIIIRYGDNLGYNKAKIFFIAEGYISSKCQYCAND